MADTGGPAFPRATPPVYVNRDDPDSLYWEEQRSGMTLLDWFAGQALSGIMAAGRSKGSEVIGFISADVATRQAYHYADAMLAEKRRRENDRA